MNKPEGPCLSGFLRFPPLGAGWPGRFAAYACRGAIFGSGSFPQRLPPKIRRSSRAAHAPAGRPWQCVSSGQRLHVPAFRRVSYRTVHRADEKIILRRFRCACPECSRNNRHFHGLVSQGRRVLRIAQVRQLWTNGPKSAMRGSYF